MRTLKKALSIFLCFVMLFTTFCFFPLTGLDVKADAEIITGEGSRTAFYAPEVIYLYPSVTSWKSATATSFQYYVGNTVDVTDIYKTPVANTVAANTGTLYFAAEEGMKDVKLSYTFQNSAGAQLEGGSVDYEITAKDGYYEIAVTDGKSPELGAQESGCYIIWNLQYTNDKDEHKAVFAVSYIYKPYVVPYGAVARLYNTQGKVNVKNENITWVSGVHSIDANATAALYPYFTTVASGKDAGKFAFSPFLSKQNKAYVETRAVSGQAPVEYGDYNAVFSSADPSVAYFYAGQTGAPMTENFSSTHPWFTNANSSDGSVKPDIYTDATFDYAYTTEDVRASKATAQVTPTKLGHITIDTSRYSNLNQIPNLAVGFMITNSEVRYGGAISTGGAAKGYWKIGDSTEHVSGATGIFTDEGLQLDALNGVTGVFAEEQNIGFPTVNGIKYAGAWNKDIDASVSSKKYTVKSIVKVDDVNDSYENIVTASAVGLNTTQVDKSSLRQAVYEASSLSGALGMKRNGGSLYYAAGEPEWGTFFGAYYNAYIALTQLDATASQVEAAEKALTEALNVLLSGKSLKVLFDVNYDGIRPNLLAVADSVSAENFSLIYNQAADSYTFNGKISQDARQFVSDTSLDEGEYTLDVEYLSGSRTVNITSGNSIVVEFFKGENQLPSRLFSDISEKGQTMTFPITAENVDLIDNFRLWFWVNGNQENAIEFNNLTYRLKLEKGSTATAYSPAAKIVDGTSYGTLPVPSREGYTFGGWYADEALTTEITAESEISARVLYAKWIPDVYSLSFDNLFNLNEWAATGNSLVTKSGAASGNNASYNSEDSSVTIVSDAKAGECFTSYDLTDYSIKIQPNTKYRFSFKVSDRNNVGKTIVFAFVYDGDGNWIDTDVAKGAMNATNIGEGEFCVEFTTPATADTFRCRFGTFSGDDGAVSVEATFSDVKLVENNAYNNTLEISVPEKTYAYGTTYGELAEAFREGYVFDGWYTGKNGTGEEITADTPVKSENLTVYSKWTANNYKVTLKTNGADFGSDKEITDLTYDVEFTLPANDYLRTGYTFAGWSKTPDGEVLYTDKQTIKNVTSDENGNAVLYAVWAPNKFNVQFDANTGAGTMAPVQVDYESGTPLPECKFEKTGYSFVGWALSSSGNSIITEAQYNKLTITAGETVTLYAVWSENTYSVTYDGNGGTGNGSTQEFLYSYAFELPSNNFTKTGYVLSGWSDTPDGEKLYNAGQKVSGLNTEKNGKITLYAVWTPVTYKIKFSGTPGTGIMDAITATYDTETVLPEGTFTRTGYHFIGWTTVAGGEVVYKAGDKALNLSSQQDGEATLHAVWELNTYEVVLKFRDADGVMIDKTIYVKHGASVQNSDIEGFCLYPRSTGTMHFVFTGWYTDTGAIENVMGNMTVQAEYGSMEDCSLSTKITPSTCAVNGKEVTTCAFCSYMSEKELPLVAHTYDEGVITTDATCLTDGVKTYTCSVCKEGDSGHVKTEPVKALGHTFEDKPETDSTCAQQGFYAHRFCTVCELAYAPDADIKAAYEDALTDYMKAEVPHTEGAAATCTTDQICTVCKTVLVEKLGHKFTVTYEASTKVDCSTTKGNYTIVRTCSACPTVEREDVVNDFLPHTFRVETIAPTCTEDGYDLHICTACAHEEKDNFVDALGHDDEGNDWVEKTHATCTEDGEKVILCNVCGKPSQTSPIPKLGHTSGEWVVTKEPTCTEKGTKSHYCTVCKEVYETEEISVVPHTYEWVTIAEPDCTTDGMKHNKCSCGKVLSTQVIPMLGHEENGEATCETDSVCLRCDEVLKEALGHDWDNGHITKDPTETEQGEREYTCLRDSNHKKYETIPVRIVIVLPEIPADGTYDLDATETLYLGNIHDIISVEKGIAYTVSVDNANILTINEDGYMMAVKDGDAVITITTNDGKYQKHLPVTVRTYKTITFDVNGVLTTVKAYVGEKFETIEVASYEDEYGYIRAFKAWLLDGEALTDFTCTGDMTLVAQFTSSCDYARFDKMAVVFEGLIGGYYDNADLITLNKQEVENAKALIAEFRADRNIRDSAEQGRVNAAADQISIVVAKIYPEDGASIEIRGVTECAAGSYADVKAYLQPIGLELADGVWTSSDTSIGFFTNGRFFAVKTGTVTLTVSRGNLSASVEINVTATTGARVVFFDSLLTNAHYILEGGYVIRKTTNLFWATDADINFRVITDGTYEEYVVFVNDKKVTPDITGTYTIPANTGDAHVRIEGMIPDYSEEDPGAVEKVSIWDLIRNFFKKIGDFFRNLFGM